MNRAKRSTFLELDPSLSDTNNTFWNELTGALHQATDTDTSNTANLTEACDDIDYTQYGKIYLILRNHRSKIWY